MYFSFAFEGNLAYDPELQVTKSGSSVCHLRVVHGRRIQKDGVWEDAPPMGITVTVWGKLAERAAKWKTGNTVFVVARDELEPWAFTRKDNGEPGALLQVTASTVGLSGRFEDIQVVEDEADGANTPWSADLDEPAERELEPSF
ncbi:single-stranded DNA-binding protein [Actinoplanes sp. HUAS TT8]|uniref:single-stranded DNA-binding protein n=1 Tax=Actinoplanes sp. HUAS TT8 TaxID=3447453 RepID=UPI003F51DB5C